MIPLAVVLALALAAGPSDPPRRTAQEASNRARAKAGLLPRKVARTRAVVVRDGHRLVRAPAPTFLPEPAPLAEDAPAAALADAAQVAGAAADPDPDDAPVADGAEEASAAAADPAKASIAAAVPAPLAAPIDDAADAGVDERLVASRGPVVVTALRGGGPVDTPDGAPAGEQAVAVAIVAPEEVGVLRAAVAGVVTEVTLSLMFEP